MQKTLDLSIKRKEIGSTNGGYISPSGRIYQSYMDNVDWCEFVRNMDPRAYENFDCGAGGELKAKGDYPPKMASWGSSSRMLYNLVQKLGVDNFEFEHKLDTMVGGVANLDGFIEKDDSLIFVEAKCREIYGGKSRGIKSVYHDLYEYISADPSNNLSISSVVSDDVMKVKYFTEFGEITCFDLKQMICHLLAIATDIIKNPTKKKIRFLYLCFNPNYIDIIDLEKSNKITHTYNKMCSECRSIDFKSLFLSVYRYLVKNIYGDENCDELMASSVDFSFELCDQSNFGEKIR